MAKNEMRYSLDQITGYLRVKGIPSQMIQQIRMALAQDAVQEADYLHWDRIYTAFALSVRRCYGFGQSRIMKCLQMVNDIMMEMGDGEKTWHEAMVELKEETGIVVRNGDDDRLIIEVGVEESEVSNDEG